VGNLLTDALLTHEYASYASYRVPHPLVHEVHLTIGGADEGSVRVALKLACGALISELDEALAGLPPEDGQPATAPLQPPRAPCVKVTAIPGGAVGPMG
jgi:hypothetical protein